MSNEEKKKLIAELAKLAQRLYQSVPIDYDEGWVISGELFKIVKELQNET